MCPIDVNGRPGKLTLHMCMDMTCLLLAKATFSGHVVCCLFSTGVPSMMKICVVPELAMTLMALVILVQHAAPVNASF
jgi:hypothetical protein